MNETESVASLSNSADTPDEVGDRRADLVGAVLLKEFDAPDGDLGLVCLPDS